MRQVKVEVEAVTKIKRDVYLMKMHAPYIASASSPGQFLHIKISSFPLLRRPFSIHKVESKSIYVLFKVRGRGTLLLAKKKRGEQIDVIGPLGRGFTQPKVIPGRVLVVGGGIGVAPLLFLVQKISSLKPVVLIGAKTKKDILCKRGFLEEGAEVRVATDDGSAGYKGTVAGLFGRFLHFCKEPVHYVYACGPRAMFYGLHKILKQYPRIKCEVSFEQFMGCGLGFCHACVIKTKNGYRRVCRDGPVFDLGRFRLSDLQE